MQKKALIIFGTVIVCVMITAVVLMSMFLRPDDDTNADNGNNNSNNNDVNSPYFKDSAGVNWWKDNNGNLWWQWSSQSETWYSQNGEYTLSRDKKLDSNGNWTGEWAHFRWVNADGARLWYDGTEMRIHQDNNDGNNDYNDWPIVDTGDLWWKKIPVRENEKLRFWRDGNDALWWNWIGTNKWIRYDGAQVLELIQNDFWWKDADGAPVWYDGKDMRIKTDNNDGKIDYDDWPIVDTNDTWWKEYESQNESERRWIDSKGHYWTHKDGVWRSEDSNMEMVQDTEHNKYGWFVWFQDGFSYWYSDDTAVIVYYGDNGWTEWDGDFYTND